VQKVVFARVARNAGHGGSTANIVLTGQWNRSLSTDFTGTALNSAKRPLTSSLLHLHIYYIHSTAVLYTLLSTLH
jgi:hypothetical protein